MDFWARFHFVKAAFAALLLLVLVPLGSRIGREYAGIEGLRRRLIVGMLGVLEALLAVLALLILVANVQGAIAPLSSALGLLPLGTSDPALAATIEQVRRSLASGVRSPALDALVHDYTVYHAAMACAGAVVPTGLLTTVVFLWRRRARVPRSQPRYRSVLATSTVVVLALVAFFGVVTAANISTVAHPAPALLGFFEGGRWNDHQTKTQRPMTGRPTW